MNRTTLILLIILAVTTIALIVLYFLGKRIQKRQDEQQAQIEANKQTFNMLVIDKKRMKITEAGFPQVVIDQTPKYLRRAKIPVVKAKVGPRVASLMCDEKIFDIIPVKKEVKAMINGIYIVDVKGLRGGLDVKPEKKGFFARIKEKAASKKQ